MSRRGKRKHNGKKKQYTDPIHKMSAEVYSMLQKANKLDIDGKHEKAIPKYEDALDSLRALIEKCQHANKTKHLSKYLKRLDELHDRLKELKRAKRSGKKKRKRKLFRIPKEGSTRRRIRHDNSQEPEEISENMFRENDDRYDYVWSEDQYTLDVNGPNFTIDESFFYSSDEDEEMPDKGEYRESHRDYRGERGRSPSPDRTQVQVDQYDTGSDDDDFSEIEKETEVPAVNDQHHEPIGGGGGGGGHVGEHFAGGGGGTGGGQNYDDWLNSDSDENAPEVPPRHRTPSPRRQPPRRKSRSRSRSRSRSVSRDRDIVESPMPGDDEDDEEKYLRKLIDENKRLKNENSDLRSEVDSVEERCSRIHDDMKKRKREDKEKVKKIVGRLSAAEKKLEESLHEKKLIIGRVSDAEEKLEESLLEKKLYIGEIEKLKKSVKKWRKEAASKSNDVQFDPRIVKDIKKCQKEIEGKIQEFQHQISELEKERVWRVEEERKKKEEDERKKIEEERKKKEEDERKRIEDEKKRREVERKRKEEEERKRIEEEERKRKEEEEKKRKEEEKRKRIEDERKRKEEEKKRKEEEKKRIEEEKRRRKEEEEKKRREEADLKKRLEEERIGKEEAEKKRKEKEEQKRLKLEEEQKLELEKETRRREGEERKQREVEKKQKEEEERIKRKEEERKEKIQREKEKKEAEEKKKREDEKKKLLEERNKRKAEMVSGLVGKAKQEMKELQNTVGAFSRGINKVGEKVVPKDNLTHSMVGNGQKVVKVIISSGNILLVPIGENATILDVKKGIQRMIHVSPSRQMLYLNQDEKQLDNSKSVDFYGLGVEKVIQLAVASRMEKVDLMCPGGKSLSFPVDVDKETIGELKEKLEKVSGMSRKSQKFIFKQGVLRDEIVIAELQIKPDEYITVKLFGGGGIETRTPIPGNEVDGTTMLGVMDINGELVALLPVKEGMTVAQAKKFISQTKKIPECQQTLYNSKTEMQDDKLLTSYNLGKDSRVMLIVKKKVDTVTVITPSGLKVFLDPNLGDLSVKKAKRFVCEKFGLPCDDYKLTAGCVTMSDELMFSDFKAHFEKDSILKLQKKALKAKKYNPIPITQSTIDIPNIVEKSISISVPGGETIVVTIRDDMTVLDLKKMVSEKSRVPIDEILFLFTGRKLEDKKHVSSYDFANSTNITMKIQRKVEKESEMFISVSLGDLGNKMTIPIKKGMTIRDAKKVVSEKIGGVPVENLSLIFAGKDLNDDYLIAKCDFAHSTTFNLKVRGSSEIKQESQPLRMKISMLVRFRDRDDVINIEDGMMGLDLYKLVSSKVGIEVDKIDIFHEEIVDENENTQTFVKKSESLNFKKFNRNRFLKVIVKSRESAKVETRFVLVKSIVSTGDKPFRVEYQKDDTLETLTEKISVLKSVEPKCIKLFFEGGVGMKYRGDENLFEFLKGTRQISMYVMVQSE